MVTYEKSAEGAAVDYLVNTDPQLAMIRRQWAGHVVKTHEASLRRLLGANRLESLTLLVAARGAWRCGPTGGALEGERAHVDTLLESMFEALRRARAAREVVA